MNDDQIDTIGSSSSICAKWMDSVNSYNIDNQPESVLSERNRNWRIYNKETLRKMLLNSYYGLGLGVDINIDSLRGINNSAYGFNGVRPKEIILDDIEMTNLCQEIAITLKIPKNLLFGEPEKPEKPEKLKINFEGDPNE